MLMPSKKARGSAKSENVGSTKVVVNTVLGLFFAAAFGACSTYWVNQRTDDAKRKTDAMLDVYFGQENWTYSMSPLEYQLRQSISREKFAVFADNDSLKKLDRLLASEGNACKNDHWSDACLNLMAKQLMIQHQALHGGSAADADAFLRIVRNEQNLQRSEVLPGIVSRYWVSFPTGLDLKGDDIPAIGSRLIPDDFTRIFPNKKYVILVDLQFETEPPVQEPKFLTCVALVGLTYQPINGERPTLPRYTTSAFVRTSRSAKTAARDCVLEAADQAIDSFLKTPSATLRQYIDNPS